MGKTSLISDRYIIADGVLLSYSGKEPNVVIPAQVNGVSIRAIGAGAFSGRTMCACSLPEGITRISDGAFWNCSSLRTVCFPGSLESLTGAPLKGCYQVDVMSVSLRIPSARYQQMLSVVRRAQDGSLFFGTDGWSEAASAIDCLSGHVMQCVPSVPKNTGFLFCGSEVNGEQLQYRFDGGTGSLPETEAAIQNERFGASGPLAAEEKLDWFVRADRPNELQMTTVLWFREEETKEQNGMMTVPVHAKKSYVFIPSVQRVRYKEKDYYVYRRHYLSDSPEVPFVRKDIGVIDKEGNVPDREEAEAVYASYRFFSML